jgi:choice-of-anchor B domain-containing protein
MLVAESPSDSLAPGRVHVYERASATAAWRRTGELNPEGAARGDRVGRGLALQGDVAVVGATRTDSMRGALYVFRKTGGQWRQEAKLRPEELKPLANFGTAVDLKGNTILAGSPAADSAAGAAWVFRRDSAGAWKMEQKLTLPIQPAARANAQLGSSVLLHEGVAYVGAPGLTQFMGAVIRFTRDSAQNRWNPAGALMPFDATPFTQFGVSIAAVGREIWVGAPNANQGQGRVFRFTPDTAGFSAVTKIAYDTAAVAQMNFGGVIVADRDLAVVGMPNADFGEGRVAILTRAAATGRWTQRHLNGPIFRPSAVAGSEVRCENGKAGMFDCGQTSLLSVVPIAEMGGGSSRLNTVWGWTDPETGKEIAIVGRSDGTSFLDVSNPNRPRYLGNLPKTPEAPATVWREFKVMNNHVFIVSDGAKDHGMQVFDLTRLRNVRAQPQNFTPDVTYRGVSAAHNVAVDTATGFVFITGANSGGETCGGGLHMVNAKDPKNLTFAGCFQDMGTGFAGTGYSHDVQCVVYAGPDTRYTGREICFGGNETHMSIGDVTDKVAPKALGRATYPNFGYIHQGWLTEDHKYLFVNDELDELQGKTPDGTRTIIFDVSKLDDPVVAGQFIGTTKASDHNLYIRGNRMYQSNYQAGLRVIDIADPLKPKEVGFFDVVPVGDNGPGFGGTWNNYPYFKSGTILVSSAREGLFLLKDQTTNLTP